MFGSSSQGKVAIPVLKEGCTLKEERLAEYLLVLVEVNADNCLCSELSDLARLASLGVLLGGKCAFAG